jgi:hypothetical protein
MSKRQLPTPEHAGAIDRALEKAVVALRMQRLDKAKRLTSQVLNDQPGQRLSKLCQTAGTFVEQSLHGAELLICDRTV